MKVNNLIFTPSPTPITDRLRDVLAIHVREFGTNPRRVWVSKAQWKNYEAELSREVRYHYKTFGYSRVKINKKWYLTLMFRGIPIVSKYYEVSKR